jgi:hypothetical protein
MLYIGDFDPSGLNIKKVVEKKLKRFANRDDITWQGIAITELQFSFNGWTVWDFS